MRTAVGSDHSLSHSPSWDAGSRQTSLKQTKEEFIRKPIFWVKRSLRLHRNCLDPKVDRRLPPSPPRAAPLKDGGSCPSGLCSWLETSSKSLLFPELCARGKQRCLKDSGRVKIKCQVDGARGSF